VPALSQYIIEPIWEQFRARLPKTKADHPLVCHKPRIPNRILFERYSAETSIRLCLRINCRRAMLGYPVAKEAPRRVNRGRSDGRTGGAVLNAYDRLIGFEPSDMAIEGCITKSS
jgi:hypothetical protein